MNTTRHLSHYATFSYILMITFLFLQSIRSGDISGILQISSLLSLCFLHLCLFSIFADYITSRFQSLGDIIYQINWYVLPVDMQKNLQSVIAMSQKRVFVRGYADVRSTREAFRKV